MSKLSDYSNKKTLISPSLLASDFANLQSEIERTEKAGAEIIHLDVMDGHFVPNISIGPPVIKSARKYSSRIFDVHLMISHPLKYIDSFVEAGADHITFHLEADSDVLETIKKIKSHGITAGISLKPGTPAEAVLPFCESNSVNLIFKF